MTRPSELTDSILRRVRSVLSAEALAATVAELEELRELAERATEHPDGLVPTHAAPTWPPPPETA